MKPYPWKGEGSLRVELILFKYVWGIGASQENRIQIPQVMDTNT